jgi:hypothetical protein
MTDNTPDQPTFHDHLPHVVRLAFRALCAPDTLDRVERLIEQLTLDAPGVRLPNAPGTRPRATANAYVRDELLAAVAEYHEFRGDLDAAIRAHYRRIDL